MDPWYHIELIKVEWTHGITLNLSRSNGPMVSHRTYQGRMDPWYHIELIKVEWTHGITLNLSRSNGPTVSGAHIVFACSKTVHSLYWLLLYNTREL